MQNAHIHLHSDEAISPARRFGEDARGFVASARSLLITNKDYLPLLYKL